MGMAVVWYVWQSWFKQMRTEILLLVKDSVNFNFPITFFYIGQKFGKPLDQIEQRPCPFQGKLNSITFSWFFKISQFRPLQYKKWKRKLLKCFKYFFPSEKNNAFQQTIDILAAQ